MTRSDQRYRIDRALASLKRELETLEELSETVTLKVRSSRETAERLKRMADEFERIDFEEEED